jgi:hypothetical protein
MANAIGSNDYALPPLRTAHASNRKADATTATTQLARFGGFIAAAATFVVDCIALGQALESAPVHRQHQLGQAWLAASGIRAGERSAAQAR